MRLPLNVAVAFLAMSMASPVAFAQDPPRGFEPGQRETPDPSAAHHCMCYERMGMRGHGELGEEHWGHRLGMEEGPGWQHAPFMLERIVDNPSIRERLGITPEQAAKIRQQTSDFRKAEIRNRADLEVKRIELHDLLSADKPDRAAIDKKLQEMSAAHLAVEKAVIDYHLAMRSALTPEQREKLEKMREEFRRRVPGHEGMPGPRGMEHPDHQGQ